MKKVIDISQWQGRIQADIWGNIKRSVDGVIIRLGYRGYGTGELKLDSEFTFNLAACKKYSIPYGFYFFSQAINEAEAQEEVALIAKVADIKAAELGVWIDSETANNGNGRADRISREQRSVAVKAFVDAVKARGANGGLYCGYYWLRDNLVMDRFTDTPFWLACYLKEPLYKGDNLYMWQFSSLNPFNIAGFGKALDCNYLYKAFGATPKPSPGKSVEELAQEVLEGKWGNGQDRVNRLTAAGYDYSAVQKRVNEILAEKKKYTTYVVKRGDTLTAIARRYNTTVNRIANDNGIKNPNLIYPGQVLKIYK